MKWIANVPEKLLECVIETDVYSESGGMSPKTVYRLFIYKNGTDIFDDLQFTLEFATEIALEEYGIPLNAWRQIS